MTKLEKLLDTLEITLFAIKLVLLIFLIITFIQLHFESKEHERNFKTLIELYNK